MNELTIPQVSGELANFTNDDFNELAKGSFAYSASLKLGTGKGEAVTAGLLPMRHWGRFGSKDDVTDLGENVDVYPIAWRSKAVLKDPLTVKYDTKDPEFQRIKGLSGDFDNGAMCGPEFLLYVPRTKEFLLYFVVSGNAKADAKILLTLLAVPRNPDGSLSTTVAFKGANLSAKLKVQGKFQNIVPVTRPVTAPIGDPPSEAALVAAITEFKNPKAWNEEEKPAEGERPR